MGIPRAEHAEPAQGEVCFVVLAVPGVWGKDGEDVQVEWPEPHPGGVLGLLEAPPGSLGGAASGAVRVAFFQSA